MCARYKSGSGSTPSPRAQGAGAAYTQAAPRRRVQPTGYEEDNYLPPEETPPAPGADYPRTAPRPQPEPRRRTHAPAPLPGYMEMDDPLQTPPGPDGRRILHCDTPDPESAFGTPGPRREYRKHAPAQPDDDTPSPWEELKSPPRKGTSLWHAISLWVFFPFRMIAFLTRKLPGVVKWLLRFLISGAFVGTILTSFLVLFYAIKSGRYDLTQVMRMPERTIVHDRKGAEIGTLHGENRRSIDNLEKEVPQYFIDALIMQEDRSFRTHGGIDPRSMPKTPTTTACATSMPSSP
ncbi:MAG: transglycosylase domain-containing protein, partial [Akkermansia sp.]|nr:transglycosylase domain-containing protein [Akkermansia sp.]